MQEVSNINRGPFSDSRAEVFIRNYEKCGILSGTCIPNDSMSPRSNQEKMSCFQIYSHMVWNVATKKAETKTNL